MKTHLTIVAFLTMGAAVAQVTQRGQSTPITPAVPTTPTTPTRPFTVPGQEPIRPLPPVRSPILPGPTTPNFGLQQRPPVGVGTPGTQIPGTTQLPGTQVPGTGRFGTGQIPGTTQVPGTQFPGTQRFRNVPAGRPPGFFQNVPASRPPGFFDTVPDAEADAFDFEPGRGNDLFPERGVSPRGEVFPERGVDPGVDVFPNRGVQPRGELFPERGVQPRGGLFPEPGVDARGEPLPDPGTGAPTLTPGDQARINRLAVDLQNLAGASRVTISQRQQLLNSLRSMSRGPNPPSSTLLTRLANNLVVAVPRMNLGPGGMAQLSADINRLLNSDRLRPQQTRIVLNDAQQLLGLSGIGRQQSRAIFNDLVAITSHLQREAAGAGTTDDFRRDQRFDRQFDGRFDQDRFDQRFD